MVDNPGVPRREKTDLVLGVLKAGLAAVPLVGGSVVELLNLALRPPLEARRDAFLNDLADRIGQLEASGQIRPEALVGNEQFTDVLIQASLAALRTRNELKRKALRNAVLNSLLPSAPEEDLQELFIGFVDSFSPWHLAIVSLLSRDPAVRPGGLYASQRVDTPVRQLVEEAFQDLSGRSDVYQHFLFDLQARGLLASTPRAGTLLDAPWSIVQVTDLGKRFLAFITVPELDSPEDDRQRGSD
ncbi:MAG: hypothetical protein L6R30_15890 [Thermoanaerobaculia bacterium]|nr:hypothetical protein [Thermoanaerobaculia bacterium]